MRQLASGLLRFGADMGSGNDDEAVEGWARTVAPLEVAPALDPYVGAVKGIGIALFCYMRMRAGADSLKPDVRQTLKRLGFEIFSSLLSAHMRSAPLTSMTSSSPIT